MTLAPFMVASCKYDCGTMSQLSGCGRETGIVLLIMIQAELCICWCDVDSDQLAAE